MEWLNRIGIILNFFAGFMLAPELIGLERLIIIESRLETALSRLISTIEKNSKQTEKLNARMKLIGLSTLPFIGKTYLSNLTRDDLIDQVFFYRLRNNSFLYGTIFLFILFAVFFHASYNNILLLELLSGGIGLALVLIFVRGLGDFINAINDNFDRLSSVEKVLFFGFMTLLTPGFYLALSFSGILGLQKIPYSIWKYQLTLFSFLLKKLIGEQRLRRLLIYWGIVLFILGNLLQLIATFG